MCKLYVTLRNLLSTEGSITAQQSEGITSERGELYVTLRDLSYTEGSITAQQSQGITSESGKLYVTLSNLSYTLLYDLGLLPSRQGHIKQRWRTLCIYT